MRIAWTAASVTAKSTALRVDFERDNILPSCACGGWGKTATISFGQSMPVNEMRRAEQEDPARWTCSSSRARHQWCIRAAGFPELAKRNGASLVIVNREPTLLIALQISCCIARLGKRWVR